MEPLPHTPPSSTTSSSRHPPLGTYVHWWHCAPTMHPLFSEVTDHNPVWAGIQWPETFTTALPKHSSSVRITNHPDLPADKEIQAQFAAALDNAVDDIAMHQPNLEHLSPQQAGLIQGMVIRASVTQSRLLSPARIIHQVGKDRSFKDGFSTEYMVLKASLHAHVAIRRLIWTPTSWRHKAVSLSLFHPC